MTTIADMIAAAKIGAIDPSTIVYTAADVGVTVAPADVRPEWYRSDEDSVNGTPAALSATEHQCGIANCRHGAAHPVVSQPDRQVKLSCPSCGAVARMTLRALAASGGIRCVRDDALFTAVARRVYNRKGN